VIAQRGLIKRSDPDWHELKRTKALRMAKTPGATIQPNLTFILASAQKFYGGRVGLERFSSQALGASLRSQFLRYPIFLGGD
jgi:hypothetical protein